MIGLGLEREFVAIQELHLDELEELKEEFEELSDKFVLTDIDQDIAAQLITTNVQRIATNVERFTLDAKGQLMSSVIAGTPDAEIIAEAKRRARDQWNSRMESNIATEINTMAQGFNREMAVIKAKDTFGDNPDFLYIGPNDQLTRPFCRDTLTQRRPPIYTLKEIQGMRNGQSLEVLTYGGGWNCRHRWQPVSPKLKGELRG